MENIDLTNEGSMSGKICFLYTAESRNNLIKGGLTGRFPLSCNFYEQKVTSLAQLFRLRVTFMYFMCSYILRVQEGNIGYKL